jgi:hypothetical protein
MNQELSQDFNYHLCQHSSFISRVEDSHIQLPPVLLPSPLSALLSPGTSCHPVIQTQSFSALLGTSLFSLSPQLSTKFSHLYLPKTSQTNLHQVVVLFNLEYFNSFENGLQFLLLQSILTVPHSKRSKGQKV